MRSKKLITYGLLGVGAYLLYKHFQATATPAPVAAAPGATPVAGLGYFPSGSDRPFARIYGGHPTAWWRTHKW